MKTFQSTQQVPLRDSLSGILISEDPCILSQLLSPVNLFCLFCLNFFQHGGYRAPLGIMIPAAAAPHVLFFLPRRFKLLFDLASRCRALACHRSGSLPHKVRTDAAGRCSGVRHSGSFLGGFAPHPLRSLRSRFSTATDRRSAPGSFPAFLVLFFGLVSSRMYWA